MTAAQKLEEFVSKLDDEKAEKVLEELNETLDDGEDTGLHRLAEVTREGIEQSKRTRETMRSSIDKAKQMQIAFNGGEPGPIKRAFRRMFRRKRRKRQTGGDSE